MKRSIASWASLVIGFSSGSTEAASAVVYCQYAGCPANCILRPGVVLHQAMSLAIPNFN